LGVVGGGGGGKMQGAPGGKGRWKLTRQVLEEVEGEFQTEKSWGRK